MTSADELERLAASVLCVGFEGASPADAPLGELARLRPGGFVLFRRNCSDLERTRTLVEAVRNSIAATGGAPPFIAIDQEGGRVSRLRRGAHDVPPMMALGAAGDPELTSRVGALLAADIRSVGAGVLLAPVVDLARCASGTAIGERSFGDDPREVAALAGAFVRGAQAQGACATLKHFPGHGSTAEDSHVVLPRVHLSLGELQERDLVPFAAGIAAGARAVMSAHVVFEAIDAERSASQSRAVLTDLLRGDLGFTGVCFSDCMEMDAVELGGGTETAAVAALAAGTDCLVISHRLELASRVRDAIVSAVRQGALSKARLQEAAARAATLSVPPVSPKAEIDEDAGREAARRAVTLVRSDRGQALPLRGTVTVVSFEGASSGGAEGANAEHPSLALALRERRVRAELLRAPLDPPLDMIEHLTSLVSAQRDREVILLSRRAHVHAGQRAALNALLGVAPDATLVAMREPFDVVDFPQARTVYCTFGDGEVSVSALADVFCGRIKPQGRMPVDLSAACPA